MLSDKFDAFSLSIQLSYLRRSPSILPCPGSKYVRWWADLAEKITLVGDHENSMRILRPFGIRNWAYLAEISLPNFIKSVLEKSTMTWKVHRQQQTIHDYRGWGRRFVRAESQIRCPYEISSLRVVELLFSDTINNISAIHVTAHICTGGPKKSDLRGRAPTPCNPKRNFHPRARGVLSTTCTEDASENVYLLLPSRDMTGRLLKRRKILTTTHPDARTPQSVKKIKHIIM